MSENNLSAFWALAPEYADQIFEAYRQARTPPASLANAELGPAAQGRDLAAADYARQITRIIGNVAVISISGPIDRATRLSYFTGSIYSLGQDAIRAAIGEALDNPEISAILLSINSPGGVVAGTKELADFIASAAAKKRMAAYVDGLCASAAFWLASATGSIYAPKTAQVGSIGVIMALVNAKGFYERLGLVPEYISSGKFKSAGRGERDLTDEERAYFQEQITSLHAIFKTDVAAFLGLERPEADWAEAQIFLADQALGLGLLAGIVSDEQAVIAKLQEETMPPKITLELLQAEAPDLLAQIRSEAAAAAKTQPDESLALAVMKSVCTDAQYAAGLNLYKVASGLGLTAGQAGGLAEALRAVPPQGTPEQDAQARRLAQINAAHPEALNSGPPKPVKSALVADAEKRSLR